MTEFAVIEEAGAAVNSNTVEVTVDLSTSDVGEGSSTRAIKKQEIIDALQKIINHIITNPSPSGQ